VLHIKLNNSDLEILQSTFAGQIGQNGVNNKGVAVGINTLANLPGGDGFPVLFNVRKILECSNIAEAIANLQNTRFAQAMNYMIGDRELVVSVETWESMPWYKIYTLAIMPCTRTIHWVKAHPKPLR